MLIKIKHQTTSSTTCYSSSPVVQHHMPLMLSSVSLLQSLHEVIPDACISFSSSKADDIPTSSLDLPRCLEESVLHRSDDKFCFCQNIEHGEMVLCDNPTCTIQWYHFSCVGLLFPPKVEWYSSRGNFAKCM